MEGANFFSYAEISSAGKTRVRYEGMFADPAVSPPASPRWTPPGVCSSSSDSNLYASLSLLDRVEMVQETRRGFVVELDLDLLVASKSIAQQNYCMPPSRKG